MKEKKRRNKREHGARTIALSQIIILVIATIAFAWMVGSEVKTVSAVGESCSSGGVSGTCIDTSTTGCDGSTMAGLCPGGNNVRCCIPSTSSQCKVCVGNVVYGGTLSGTTCTPDYSKISTTCLTGTTCSNGNCVEDNSGTGNGNNGGGVVNGIVKVGSTVSQLAGTADAGIRLYEKLFGTKTKQEVVKDIVKSETKNTLAGAPTTQASLHLTLNDWLNPFNGGASYGEGKTAAAWDNVANVFNTAIWATGTALAIQYIAKTWMKSSDRNLADINLVTWGAAGLVVAYAIVNEIAAFGGPVGWIGAAVVAAAFGLYMLIGYQDYSREIFTFRTELWQPSSIGSECNKCNSLRVAGTNEKACSEYICHSYGTACEWVNTETQYETCIENNTRDSATPVITPAKEIYGENIFPANDNANYDYSINSAGAKIIYKGEGAGTGQCVPAYTSITIAFTTNENAQCKIGLEASNATAKAEDVFSKMQDLTEGTVYTTNHSLKLPSSVTADAASLANAGYVLTNSGTFRFYIRCKDVRQNINRVDYIMQFCTQTGPDTHAPNITRTNPPTGAYITYNTTNITNFQVFTDEPAECRWDTKPAAFSNMVHGFEWCSSNLNDYMSEFDYGCVGNLTGFKNGVENIYYVACKDHPEWKGNATMEAKRNTGKAQGIVLEGTTRLLINSVKINDKPNNSLIRSAQDIVDVNLEVMTSGGAEGGNARCTYSEDGKSYSLFSNGGSRDFSTTNTETLSMPPGKYKFFIQCYDIAMPTPNINTTMINFTVETDTTAPNVVRVYKDENSNYLKIITDEVAECVYSIGANECVYNFDEGTLMETEDGLVHSVEWDSENDFYIKCRDEFEHSPADGQCSIIARPFEIAQEI
jgi:hypothetical protein